MENVDFERTSVGTALSMAMNRDLEELIWNRAGDVCEYCRLPQQFDDLPFEIDHVTATSHGTNLASGRRFRPINRRHESTLC